jgi:hypothetical protein
LCGDSVFNVSQRYTKAVLVFNVRARGYEPGHRGLADAEALKFSLEGAVEHRLKEIVQTVPLVWRN